MFRFGLKKEEKDMISFTLTELRELRVELSGLRDALARMAPGEQPDGQADQAAALEAEPGQPAPGLAGCGPGEDAAGLAGAFPAAGSEVEECAEAPGEEAGEDSAKGCNEVPAAETACPDLPAAVSRDWAVVNLAALKRPWWKFWEPAKRITKRSI